MSRRRESKAHRVATVLGLPMPFMGRLVVAAATVFLLALTVPLPLAANPAGGAVVRGSAAIDQPSSSLTVIHQQSHKAIINWKSFSIQEGEKTQFIQPGGNSIALNRVIQKNPSQILGQLKANGQVWLVNPNGVFFGPHAKVNVAGILATTADITNDNFMAGRYEFSIPSPNPAASVVNQGTISVRDTGLAGLVAPTVRNDGLIEAHLGEVILGGVPTFTLDFDGDGLIQFQATSKVLAGSNQSGPIVENTGKIQADGGTVLVTARALQGVVNNAINMGGLVQARSCAMKNGAIVLDGGDSGVVAVTGTLDASGKSTGQKGGSATVTGDKVGLFAGSVIDASGDAGGGNVNIGGGRHGANPAIRNANEVYMDSKAKISADATGEGNGGDVVVWSENYTNFQGAISAQGGPNGGNGGQVETSSRSVLDASGSVSTFAPEGNVGDWLLDPSGIYIQNAGSDNFTSVAGGLSVFDPKATTGNISPATIIGVAGTNPTGLYAGDVTIQTHAGSLGTGDIVVQSSINIPGGVDLGAPRTLTLEADRNITINSNVSIDVSNGVQPLNVNLYSNANASNSGGSIFMDSGSAIRSNGGNITLAGGYGGAGYAKGIIPTSPSAYSNGIIIVATTLDSRVYSGGTPLDSGGGSISLAGTGADLSSISGILYFNYYQARGVDIESNSVLSGGNIAITGLGGSSYSTSDGIFIAGSTLSTAVGAVQMTGTGGLESGLGGDGVTSAARGIMIQELGNVGSTISAGAGGVQMTGTGGGPISGGSTQNADGIWVELSSITAGSGGPVNLAGTGGTGTSSAYGLIIQSNSTVQTGSGGVQMSGTGGGGNALNVEGINITSSDIGTTGAAQIDLFADVINLAGTTTIQSPGGDLAIAPITSGNTVGLGSSSTSGTLQLPQSYFLNGATGFIRNTFSSVTIGSATTGSITAGDLTFADNLRLTNGATGIAVNGALNVGTNELTFDSIGGGSETSTGSIHAGSLDLLGAGGTYSLTNAGNSVTTIAGDAAKITYSQAGDISIGTVGTTAGVSTTGDVNISTPGILDINQPVTDTGTGITLIGQGGINLNEQVTATNGNITLATAGTFTNSYGTTALSAPSGIWLVYSADPANDTRGGLPFDFIQYNASYDFNYNVGANPAPGSGFLYSISPTVGVSLTGVTKVYDGTPDAALTQGNYVLTGVFDGDTVTLNPSTGTYYDPTGVNVDSNVDATVVKVSGLAIASETNGGKPIYGTLDGQPVLYGAYQLRSGSISGNGTITPESLTYTAATDTKTYNGTTTSTGASTLTSGTLYNGDTFTGITQSFVSANALGTNGSTLTADATDAAFHSGGNDSIAADYSISTQTAPGTINPAPLIITANNATRAFGAPNPTFSASFSGLAPGDAPSAITGLQLGTNADLNSTPGQYPIIPSDATSPNYRITYVNGALTIIEPPFVPFYSSVIPPDNLGNQLTPAFWVEGTQISSAAAVGLPPLLPWLSYVQAPPGIPLQDKLLFSNDGNMELWGAFGSQ